MIAVDEVDHVRDRHAAAGFHSFEGLAEFCPLLRVHAYHFAVSLGEVPAQSRGVLGLEEFGAILEEVQLRELGLGSQFFEAVVCRWLAGKLSDARIFPRPLDPAQVVIMILVSFPKGIGRW